MYETLIEGKTLIEVKKMSNEKLKEIRLKKKELLKTMILSLL